MKALSIRDEIVANLKSVQIELRRMEPDPSVADRLLQRSLELVDELLDIADPSQRKAPEGYVLRTPRCRDTFMGGDSPRVVITAPRYVYEGEKIGKHLGKAKLFPDRVAAEMHLQGMDWLWILGPPPKALAAVEAHRLDESEGPNDD